MANQTTTTGSLWLPAYWNKVFLEECRNAQVFYDLGDKSTAPNNLGTTVHWLTMADLTASAALSESFDPTEHSLSAGDKSATLAEYGGVVKISTFLQKTAISGTVENIVERLGDNAGVTLDTVIRDGVFSAAATVRYGLSAVVRTSIDTNTGNDFGVATIRKAVNIFHKAKIKPKEGGDYVAVAHPDVIYDLQGDSNWTNAHTYTEKGIDSLYNGETGKLYGVRFIQNNLALCMDASGSASTDIYQTYFVGNQAFGVSELYNPQVIIKNPYPSALDVVASYGWKTAFAYKAFDVSALIRWETGASLGT